MPWIFVYKNITLMVLFFSFHFVPYCTNIILINLSTNSSLKQEHHRTSITLRGTVQWFGHVLGSSLIQFHLQC